MTSSDAVSRENISDGRRRSADGAPNTIPPMSHDPWGNPPPNRESRPAYAAERATYIPMGGSISEPPKFSADAYGEFRRNLRFTKEADILFEDGQLAVRLAAHSDAALQIISIRYIDGTPTENRQRNAETIIKRLGEEFDRANQETVIKKINDLMNISRRSGDDIRLFWARVGISKMAVGLSATVLPDTVLYSRALQALRLSGANRAVLVSGLGGSCEIPALNTLTDASAQIFGNSSAEASRLALDVAEEECRPDYSARPGETWQTKGKGEGKSPNRPGANAA